MYTYKIEQAIRAATLLHREQVRKGGVPLPYISHLMSTMILLRDYTHDEDTLVAALLHDTLEDTDYTREELQADFGEIVTKYVTTLTEPQASGETKPSWEAKKRAYNTQLQEGPIEAVMISSADKIHNFRSIVEEYFDHHDRFLRDFGSKLDLRLEVYQDMATTINNRLKDGIVHEFNRAFEAYKDFVIDVKKSRP